MKVGVFADPEVLLGEYAMVSACGAQPDAEAMEAACWEAGSRGERTGAD